MSELLGVPTTCDFEVPSHPCDEHDCLVCLCHIAKCKRCWSESEEELRGNARCTWLLVLKSGGEIAKDGLFNPIRLEDV